MLIVHAIRAADIYVQKSGMEYVLRGRGGYTIDAWNIIRDVSDDQFTDASLMYNSRCNATALVYLDGDEYRVDLMAGKQPKPIIEFSIQQNDTVEESPDRIHLRIQPFGFFEFTGGLSDRNERIMPFYLSEIDQMMFDIEHIDGATWSIPKNNAVAFKAQMTSEGHRYSKDLELFICNE